MALNLLPILPLDGGRVIFSLLPHQLAWQYSRIVPFGLFIVIGLLATGVLGTLIDPMMSLGEWIVRLVL
jgi:Zn-dependent protease